ncbi:hypothetical protein VN97_g4939 [Penicillium thymicola]|uniref:Uncharacterized protein n=1 Tax=Penicillium thymicola TaxID=293382 RepID=A0AAI9TKE6_PENTH|nr:hypothetical protein VN97_g4939 [Penicillium thymicola]
MKMNICEKHWLLNIGSELYAGLGKPSETGYLASWMKMNAMGFSLLFRYFYSRIFSNRASPPTEFILQVPYRFATSWACVIRCLERMNELYFSWEISHGWTSSVHSQIHDDYASPPSFAKP